MITGDAVQGFRRAALTLHALGAADREWVLGSLPVHQCQTLEGMLRELRELGIPPGEDLLRDAAPPNSAPQIEDNAQVLDRCDASALTGVLRSEPAGLTCALLAAHPWRWREEAIAALDAQVATRVRDGSKGLRGPALEDAIVSAMLRRMPSAKQQPDRLPSAWTGLANRLGWRRRT